MVMIGHLLQIHLFNWLTLVVANHHNRTSKIKNTINILKMVIWNQTPWTTRKDGPLAYLLNQTISLVELRLREGPHLVVHGSHSYITHFKYQIGLRS